MKKITAIIITSLLFFLFSTLSAQDSEILKAFINKNDFALRSVQKHTILSSSESKVSIVKTILKLQLISVKFYEIDKELCTRAAYQARILSVDFLQNNSEVPSETFRLKEKETAWFGTQEPINSPNKHLTKSELKSIEKLEVNDPSAFNSFVTSINK